MNTKSKVQSMFGNDNTLPKSESNWETLPEKTREMVREMILSAAQDRAGPEGWKADDECIEELEFVSRDGFIAFSDNRGGVAYRNFTMIVYYYGGCYTPAHEKAAKEIQRQIDYSLKCAREEFFKKHEAELVELGFTKDSVNYHDLYEKNESDLAEEFSVYELDNMSDDSSSVMHEFRFLYHGEDSSGLHTASVSAALNTEGPYHRSHISWAPGVFCEGAKEVEITWKNSAELRRKLAKTLEQVSKEIF